jgi:hypothetical protein
VGAAKTTIGPLDQCGVWAIEGQEPSQAASSPGRSSSSRAVGEADTKAEAPKLEFACNLANRVESDLRPPELRSSPAQADLLGIGGRPIWFYLTLAGLILITIEWHLYQRRWIS